MKVSADSFVRWYVTITSILRMWPSVLKTVVTYEMEDSFQYSIILLKSCFKEMRNSYRYLREELSGKYLALYVIMENGVFVIIVNYTLYIYTKI